MLSREDYFMIKQLREQGAFLVDIAHQVGCSERTVKRMLALPAPPTGRPKKPRTSKLDTFKTFVDQQLANGVWNAAVIFLQLKEQGYTGGSSILRTYIQPKRKLRPSKQTVRFETLPGQQLQHDWGELHTRIGGQRCKVYIAVNSLGYSRRFHVWATFSLDAEHTYESLVRALRAFGGVPRQVLVDNQKSAVLLHRPGEEIRFNEGFLQLAAHYGFAARACRPYRARTKGKVERMVGYVKQHFFERYRDFESLAHLNQQLEDWMRGTADQRVLRQFDQRPVERFAQEAAALQALPPTDFDTSYYDLRQVSWDAYIDVRGNRYSVPAEYCGHGVSIRIGLDDQLRVYSQQDVLIASHTLQGRRDGWVTEPGRHSALWKESKVQQRSLSRYEEVLA